MWLSRAVAFDLDGTLAAVLDTASGEWRRDEPVDQRVEKALADRAVGTNRGNVLLPIDDREVMLRPR
jgi:hypothetical protein